jgi:hypothetical protein
MCRPRYVASPPKSRDNDCRFSDMREHRPVIKSGRTLVRRHARSSLAVAPPAIMLSFTLRLMLTVAAALTPFRAVDAVPTATTPRSVGSMFDNPAFTRPPVVQGPHWNATSHPSSPQPGAAAAISAPYWVVYSDAWVSGENGPPTVSTINVSTGARDALDLSHCSHHFRASTFCEKYREHLLCALLTPSPASCRFS